MSEVSAAVPPEAPTSLFRTSSLSAVSMCLKFKGYDVWWIVVRMEEGRRCRFQAFWATNQVLTPRVLYEVCQSPQSHASFLPALDPNWGSVGCGTNQNYDLSVIERDRVGHRWEDIIKTDFNQVLWMWSKLNVLRLGLCKRLLYLYNSSHSYVLNPL
jgi:hypothetical protein